MFSPDRMYAFDSETDNSQGFGLNPLKAPITDLSLATDQGEQVFSAVDGRECPMFDAFDDALYGLPAGIVFTWGGTWFDLPYLESRLQRVGKLQHSFVFTPVPYPPKYEPTPGHDTGLTATILCKTGVHVHLDIAYAYIEIAKQLGVKWGLKPVSKALGLEPVELDREHLEKYSDEERRDYAGSDARCTRALGMNLLGVPGALALGQQAA